MNLGKVIRNLRKENGMTQQSLANELKTQRSYICLVEKSSENVSSSVMSAISKLFNIPLPILYFMAMDESDIAEDKRSIFATLKSPINSMIKELF